MIEEGNNTRLRIIVISVLILVVLLGVWGVFWVSSHGRLSLDINHLKIEPKTTVLDKDGRTVVEEIEGYQINKTLPSGDYVARVVSGVNVSEKSITIGNFLSETRDSVEVVDGLFTLPITNTPVYKPKITDSGLRFIDTIVWRLGEYRDSDLVYYNTPTVTDVAWVDDNSGYIITQSAADNQTRLGLLSGGSLLDIPLPVPTSLPISIYYNGDALYLVLNDKLYQYLKGSFKELSTVATNSIIAFANDSLVGVTSTPSDSFEDKDTTLKIINHNGETKLERNLGTSETLDLWSSAAVSADGSLIAIGEQGRVSIYSSSDFSEVYTLPSIDIGTLIWADNNLIYATGNMLWRYVPEQKLAQSITELLPYMSIVGVLAHNDDIYVINQKTDTSSLLKVTDESNITVETLDGTETTFVEPGCYFNYIYINQPQIFIHQESDDISRCIEPLSNLIRSVGLNPEEVSISKSRGDYNPY